MTRADTLRAEIAQLERELEIRREQLETNRECLAEIEGGPRARRVVQAEATIARAAKAWDLVPELAEEIPEHPTPSGSLPSTGETRISLDDLAEVFDGDSPIAAAACLDSIAAEEAAYGRKLQALIRLRRVEQVYALVGRAAAAAEKAKAAVEAIDAEARP